MNNTNNDNNVDLPINTNGTDEEDMLHLWQERYGNMIPEKIIDTKIGEDGRRYYKVQWAASTMEPSKNFLEAELLIQKYWDPVEKRLKLPSKGKSRSSSSQNKEEDVSSSLELEISHKNKENSNNDEEHLQSDIAEEIIKDQTSAADENENNVQDNKSPNYNSSHIDSFEKNSPENNTSSYIVSCTEGTFDKNDQAQDNQSLPQSSKRRRTDEKSNVCHEKSLLKKTKRE